MKTMYLYVLNVTSVVKETCKIDVDNYANSRPIQKASIKSSFDDNVTMNSEINGLVGSVPACMSCLMVKSYLIIKTRK